MEVKWMSRDVAEGLCECVEFYCMKPIFMNDSRYFVPDDNDDECFSVPASLVSNAPEPGTCVPVESFKPIKVTVKQEPKNWLACNSDGSFSFFRCVDAPPLKAGFFCPPNKHEMYQGSLCLSFANEFVMPNHNLCPGQCCEVPRKA